MSCDFDANLCYNVVSFFDFVTNLWFWFLKILRNQRISGSKLSENFEDRRTWGSCFSDNFHSVINRGFQVFKMFDGKFVRFHERTG